MYINRHRSTHSSQLERWLGAQRVEEISRSMRGWYGKPLALIDVPGCVKIGGDGDFHGVVNRGVFLSALDDLELRLKAAFKVPQYSCAAGFTSVGDALARASSGFGQVRNINKSGSTGVVSVTSSLWRVGNQPVAGVAPAAAPGGTAFTGSSTGALRFASPGVGTNRLVGADIGANIAGNSLLIYDLIFGVNKTMNSTAAENVTGVPTRYQSSVDTDEDASAGNFVFIQVGGTALAATAHNWTGTYTDQSGNTGAVLPSVVGNASGIVDRLDQQGTTWFAPLTTDDYGIKALTQMTCSALVATGVIWWMIGHPLGVCAFPIVNMVTPFDWITNRNQAPRVFDNACLAFLELMKPSTAATAYGGAIYTTSTSS